MSNNQILLGMVAVFAAFLYLNPEIIRGLTESRVERMMREADESSASLCHSIADLHHAMGQSAVVTMAEHDLCDRG